jgi:hypothetical protein
MAQYIESLDFPPGPTHTDVKSATSWLDAEVEVSVATYQAYQILYYAFIALMAVAGTDKFLRLITTWELYVSPSMASFFHMSPGAVTTFAGIVELAAAATVALKPRIGSQVVTAWLGLIVLNLLTMSAHYDMLLNTLALFAAAWAFTRLSAECN